MTNLLTRPALELAALVRSGQISSRELVEAALQRSEAHKDLNALARRTALLSLATFPSCLYTTLVARE
jgi:Asp-tRNA(Asn)/Glu-tRNA(Gln) amidotransferase A subunit family amidase